jgi:transposase-like protein
MPTKYSPEVAQEIVKSMQSGIGAHRAAAREGINDDTLRGWRREGEREPEGRYGWLARECRKAEADVVGRAESCIVKAVDQGDVKAAMWFLSKKVPTEYGEKITVETTQEATAPMDAATKTMVTDTLRALRAASTNKARADKAGEEKH